MIFFIILWLLAFSLKIDMLDFFAPISHKSHEFCLKFIPIHENSEVTSALICGEPLSNLEVKSIFIRSSLYHLIVVSASHLTWISLFFSFIFFKSQRKLLKLFIFSIFIVYSFMCLLQAPLIRALFGFLFRNLSRSFKWGFNEYHILLFSILSSLVFHPGWVQSESLILSSLCSLSLIAANSFRFSNGLENISAYILTLPAFWGWGSVHPLGIIYNLFLSPFIGIFWIPLALISFFNSKILFIYDSFLSYFIKSLALSLDSVPIQSQTGNVNQFFILWVYFWFIYFILFFRKRIV